MHPAEFCHEAPDGKVQCDLCRHFCCIMPGRSGICRVRTNVGGRLFSMNYGVAVSQSPDPVEKKPLYHFMPGTKSWSFGAPGCNFTCANCQNWQISQATPGLLALPQVPPREIVDNAIKAGCPSISCTYTEPTVFAEYALDVMRLAKGDGLRTAWVSNGFMSPNCLEAAAPLLDAANIDLKSMDDAFYRRVCGARVEPVLDNLRRIYRSGIHLEVTTLLIPGHSDSPAMLERLAAFIAGELGREVPWHVTPFHPGISWKMQGLPATRPDALEAAWDIGRKAGLYYVYAGQAYTDTVCPECGRKAIERRPGTFGAATLRIDDAGCCEACHASLSITR